MAKTPFLPYGRQTIDEDDIAAVVAVLESDYLTTGPAVRAFESEAEKVLGARHAVACSNGTAALHMCAMALGLGPEDTVIVPSMTFVATANASQFTGAQVVFANVDKNSGIMTPETLASALERTQAEKVKAVFPVHLAGHICDMAGLAQVLQQHAPQAVLIEDACHVFGGGEELAGSATKTGACTHSIAACFSLHPVKTFTTGEGGIVTTNDPDFAEKLQRFRTHGLVYQEQQFENKDRAFDPATGAVNPWYYELQTIGPNYRLTDIQCALGLAQLQKLPFFLTRRQELVALYDELLQPLAPAVLPMAGTRHNSKSWHLYAARFDFTAFGGRTTLMHALREKGIGTQVHYIPVHSQPYYQRQTPDLTLAGAEHYYQHTLSLPLFPTMQDTDVERVVAALKELRS